MAEEVSSIGVKLSLNAGSFMTGMTAATEKTELFVAAAKEAQTVAGAGSGSRSGPSSMAAQRPVQIPVDLSVSSSQIKKLRSEIIAGIGVIPIEIQANISKAAQAEAKAVMAAVATPTVGTRSGARVQVESTVRRNAPTKREHGGPVYPGQDYLVGERQAEVFRPAHRGRIVPSQDQYRREVEEERRQRARMSSQYSTKDRMTLPPDYWRLVAEREGPSPAAEAGILERLKRVMRRQEGGRGIRPSIPIIRSLEQLESFVAQNPGLYSRWTPSIKRDMQPGATSAAIRARWVREAGISAFPTPIAGDYLVNPTYDLGPSRREYDYRLKAGTEIHDRPFDRRSLYLLQGQQVGAGIDREPLLDPTSIRPVAAVSRRAVNEHYLKHGASRGARVRPFCSVCGTNVGNATSHPSTAKHQANLRGGSRGSGDWLKGPNMNRVALSSSAQDAYYDDLALGEYDYKSPGKAYPPASCPTCHFVNWAGAEGPRANCFKCGSPMGAARHGGGSVRAMGGRRVAREETELGTERQCSGCGDFWPEDSEFWYMDKQGRVMGNCRACWSERSQSSYAAKKMAALPHAAAGRLDVSGIEGNFRKYYASATPAQHKEGAEWYQHWGKELRKEAKRLSVEPRVLTSVAAALSPNNGWPGNFYDAVKYAEASSKGLPMPKASTFGANQRKAWAILQENDPDILKGLKVTEFGGALLGEEGARPQDIWMKRAALDDLTLHRSKGTPSPGQRREMNRVVDLIAQETGLEPRQVQAIIWTSAREQAMELAQRTKHARLRQGGGPVRTWLTGDEKLSSSSRYRESAAMAKLRTVTPSYEVELGEGFTANPEYTGKEFKTKGRVKGTSYLEYEHITKGKKDLAAAVAAIEAHNLAQGAAGPASVIPEAAGPYSEAAFRAAAGPERLAEWAADVDDPQRYTKNLAAWQRSQPTIDATIKRLAREARHTPEMTEADEAPPGMVSGLAAERPEEPSPHWQPSDRSFVHAAVADYKVIKAPKLAWIGEGKGTGYVIAERYGGDKFELKGSSGLKRVPSPTGRGTVEDAYPTKAEAEAEIARRRPHFGPGEPNELRAARLKAENEVVQAAHAASIHAAMEAKEPGSVAKYYGTSGVPQHEAPEVIAHKAVMEHAAETKYVAQEAVVEALEAAAADTSGRVIGPSLYDVFSGPPSHPFTRDAAKKRFEELGLFTIRRGRRQAGGDVGNGLYVVNEVGPEAFIEGKDINKLRANRPDIYARIPGAADGAKTGMINKPPWSMFAPQKDGLIVRREDAFAALSAVRAQDGMHTEQDRFASTGPLILPQRGFTPSGPLEPISRGVRDEDMLKFSIGIRKMGEDSLYFSKVVQKGSSRMLEAGETISGLLEAGPSVIPLGPPAPEPFEFAPETVLYGFGPGEGGALFTKAVADAAAAAMGATGGAGSAPPPGGRRRDPGVPGGYRTWDDLHAAHGGPGGGPPPPPPPGAGGAGGATAAGGGGGGRRPLPPSGSSIDLDEYRELLALGVDEPGLGMSGPAKAALAAGKEKAMFDRLASGNPRPQDEAIAAARQARAGSGLLMSGRRPGGMAAVFGEMFLGGGQKQRRLVAEAQEEQRKLNVMGTKYDTVSAKVAEFQAAIDLVGESSDEAKEILPKLTMAQDKETEAKKNFLDQQEKLEAAQRKATPSANNIIKSYAGIIAATNVYSLALQASQVLVEAAGPAAKSWVDEMVGFSATSQRMSKEIGASARDMGGNVAAAIAQASGRGGIGAAGFTFAQEYLPTGVTAKGGALAAQQSSDIYRAISGAIRGAPEGLLGGYGGIGGGGFLAEQLGGGKGSAEIITKDIAALAGQATLLTTPRNVPTQLGLNIPLGETDEYSGVPQENRDQAAEVMRLQTAYIDDSNSATQRYTKRMGEADSGLKLATAANVEDYEAKSQAALAAAKTAAEMPTASNAVKDWYERVKDLTAGGAILLDAQGEAADSLGEFVKYFEQVAGGQMIPELAQLVAQQKEAIKAGREIRAQQAERVAEVEIPYSVTKQLLQQPQMRPGLGLFERPGAEGQVSAGQMRRAGLSGISGAVTGALGEQAKAQANLSAIATEGLASARAEIAEWGTATDSAQFEGAYKAASDASSAIAGMTSKMMRLNQAASQANWANQIRLATRALSDALGLQGKAGASRVGQLQREQHLIERASTALDLALKARQIATQVALAGFQAPGETGEERYMRQKERLAEASIAQRQLGLQRDEFAVAGELWTKTAQRAGEDAQAALGVMRQAREAEGYSFVAATAIAARQQELAVYVGRMDNILGKATGNWQEALEFAGNAAKEFGYDVEDGLEAFMGSLGFKQNRKTGNWYKPTGGNNDPIVGPNSSGYMGRWAPGFIGGMGGGATFTVGEAGPETVAILRNPRTHMLQGEGGGMSGPINININGPVVRNDQDISSLARAVAEEVERTLSRKGQLLGLRSPAY